MSGTGSTITRRLWAPMVLLLAGSVLAACGNGSSSKDDTSGGANDNGKKIGILVLVQADEQGQRALKAVQKEATQKGYSTSVIDAQYDPTKSQAAMDTFINQGVDAIVTFATDNELLKAKIKSAGDADIPVVAITGGPAVPGIAWSIDNPEEDYAKQIADKLFTAVEKGNRAKTAVEMILPDAVPCRRREAGFDQAAKEHPDIKVTKYKIDGNNAVASANSYFQQYLQANKDLGGVVSCWDIPTEGTLTAAKGANVGTFPVMAINGSSQLVERMQAKDPFMQADVGVALAEAGRNAVVQIDNILRHKSTDIPKSRYSTIKWGIFTPDSLPPSGGVELSDWLPSGWTQDYWK
jgi:ABC-type sugar transport system substrate-binding protein